MKIIDRYVIRQLLPPILLGLLVFTFVLIIPQIKEYAESFIAKGVSPLVVLHAILLLVPQALALTIPMSFLLGLLIAFSRLSADREFVAMQACGMSLARLLRPVGLISVICAGATFYIWAVVVPDSNQRFREIAFNVVAQRAEYKVRSRVFFDDFPNLMLYVRDVPTSGGGWNGVFISDTRNSTSPSVFLARHGRVAIDQQRRAIELVLEARRPAHGQHRRHLRGAAVRSSGAVARSADGVSRRSRTRLERDDHRRAARRGGREGEAGAVGAQRAHHHPPQVVDPGGVSGVRADRHRARGHQPP